LDSDRRPASRQSLAGHSRADLAIVGAGFTGLWTALLAKERDPGREVILIEGDRIGWAATGRNGGFCAASLTHGEANGRNRFPAEYDQLERLGMENLDGIQATVLRYDIQCDFERVGSMSVATQPYQVDELRAAGSGFLNQDEVRAEIDSPTYLAGNYEREATAMLNPAALAWGLAAAAEDAGVRFVEHTQVSSVERYNSQLRLSTSAGAVVTADQVALGTNAFPSLLKRLRPYTVPVYDYVLVTEPLSSAQLDAIGWRNRQGVDDTANQFHYYRLTADNRILWGGYDAIYHFGRKIKPAYDQRPATFTKLAEHFFGTFPQLDGLKFSHCWGGAIDTCTRFFAFYGTGFSNRLAYALGYTGLGVGASRFGANVMLDLLNGTPTERTELEMVRRKPLPFPPEPAAFIGIEATRRALAQADRNEGRRNLWLRSLDRLGLGFDS
jgi:glycine/D-amino acid oxidase-like deaminating enzyme